MKDRAILSLEEQGRLIELERQRDDSDITDEVTIGTTVEELLADANLEQAKTFLEQLGFNPVVKSGIIVVFKPNGKRGDHLL